LFKFQLPNPYIKEPLYVSRPTGSALKIGT